MLQKLQLNSQNKILAVSFIIFVLLYLIINAKMKEQEPANDKKPVYADTLIPRGHVLVPIELANIQALSGLIDQYGIIDLYGGSEKDSVLLGSRVKILKAPLNPNQYAVMVSEELSKEIMKFSGPFWAVVQNRFSENPNSLKSDTKAHKRKPENKAQKIEIDYNSEVN